MRCAVCRLDDNSVRRWHTAGGADYGSAHAGECAGLLWEAHFLSATGATEDDQSLMLWKWRRRAAEVAGVAFLEAMPLDATDRAALKTRARLGVKLDALGLAA